MAKNNISKEFILKLIQDLREKIDKSISALHKKIDDHDDRLRNDVDHKISNIYNRLWWLVGLVLGSILVPIFLRLFLK